ncbi:MAG: HEPN domain-containing protein [Candidatus Electrothrix aestuarii]|uniref:HEPN domain-containing protein n=1 Tax=Candidatus Electrothrix aestuarii TaxID=3062594 RepID=A0AAU8LYB6_9BACT|nr:HEPN domain-containing protein [Candidatus Electrothrix aestuarii]
MKLITREWLDRAKDDLAVIEEIIDNHALTNMVAFHAQQAVEKTLKAVIEEYEIAFVRTHKLEFLLEKTKAHLNFPVDMQSIRRLDEVYTEARYPSELGLLPYGKPSEDDARTMQEFARNLHENVESVLQ